MLLLVIFLTRKTLIRKKSNLIKLHSNTHHTIPVDSSLLRCEHSRERGSLYALLRLCRYGLLPVWSKHTSQLNAPLASFPLQTSFPCSKRLLDCSTTRLLSNLSCPRCSAGDTSCSTPTCGSVPTPSTSQASSGAMLINFDVSWSKSTLVLASVMGGQKIVHFS